MTDWRPTASLQTLHRRARMLADIRAFFAERNLLEVQTPALSSAGNPDPSIDSLACELHLPGSATGRRYYLHTSPEFAMKRLLAAGSGDIYQLCRVFRDGEAGRLHSPEFTMLEWYRVGFGIDRLIEEVAELIRRLLDRDLPSLRLGYREAFERALALDPFRAETRQLAEAAAARGLAPDGELHRDAWLNLLMSQCVEPTLPEKTLVFIDAWPASQASLARLGPDGSAQRFELYLDGIELANGFEELTDAAEQRRRFEADNRQRAARGQPQMPLDQAFLTALEAGMPDCAGVAMGIDRLLMLACRAERIGEVMAFAPT